jgi:F-type H+-transporting ATPase subunit delta
LIRARIAQRYTRALFELAKEAGQMEPIGQDLAALASVLASEETLRTSLLSPGLTRAVKSQIIDVVVEALKPHAFVANFLRVLLDARKLSIFPDVAAAYRGMLDEALGRVRGQAITAIPLDEPGLDALSGALSAALRKDVILAASTDPSILGGVVARVGNLVFDGSLRTQLDRMRETLTKG